jgi:glycosyltransferase involved in cell wall biosynthesis
MIEYVEPFLQKDDVIFVRGGFRGWYDPFLLKMEAQKRWLILYAANTGRQRWMLWNVVLSDLNTNHGFDKRQRAFLMFNKPIAPSVFYTMGRERDIDVCIGASKIHDKKAQWRVIDALIEYQRIHQKALKCILPGSMKYRGTETPQIVPKINKHNLNVEQPGFVDRYKLNEIYNRSKVYVYLGNSGENDRGPLEATSVGCPTILGGTTRHAPFLRSCKIGITISKDPTNPTIVANEIHQMLDIHTEGLRQHVAGHFDMYNGFESVVIPQMTCLFNIIRNNPTPNMKCLKEAYSCSMDSFTHIQ